MSSRKPTIHVKREPSGRLSRSTETLIAAAPPAAGKRLHQAAVDGVGDPLYGTETGRLALAGQLTPTQLECAKRWGRLVGEYYRATGAPLPYPPAPGGIHAYAEDDPPITTPAGKALKDERERIKAEMLAASKALGEAGAGPANAVRACCEYNEVHVGHVGLLNLRAGLDRLARHWRLSR